MKHFIVIKTKSGPMFLDLIEDYGAVDTSGMFRAVEERRQQAETPSCDHGNDPKYCEVCHPELESDEDNKKRTTPQEDL